MAAHRILRSLLLTVLVLSAQIAHAGMTWQRVPIRPTTEFLNSVSWGNGQFVAVGASLTGFYGTVLTSPNGIDWTVRPTPVVPILAGNATLLDLHWNGSQWIAVGQQGGPGAEPIALTSPDGLTWTVHVLPFDPSPMLAVAWKSGPAPNFYLGTGSPGMSNVVPLFRSDDGGTTWTGASIVGSMLPMYTLLWDGNKFVTAGGGGLIWTSFDGSNWTTATSNTSNHLYGSTLSAGTYIAVGNIGTIVSSPNGNDWTLRSSGGSTPLYDVAGNGQIFVAVGHGNVVLSSPNGADWHAQPSPAPLGTPEQSALNDVVWGGNNRWVAVGNFGDIIYSDDTTPVELLSFSVE